MKEGKGLRIVIAGADALAMLCLHSASTRAGHRVVAWVHARTLRPGMAVEPHTGRVITEILRQAPIGMNVFLPGDEQGLVEGLTGYRSDALVSCGLPWKLSESVLHTPRLGALNIHPSLLPRHRGPMPIAWAIRQGEAHFGITLHRMTAALDAGNILAIRGGIPFPEDPTPNRLWRRIDPVVRVLLPEALDKLARGVVGTPQDDSLATYEGPMEPAFYRLNWSHRAVEIHNQVRAHRSLFGDSAPVAEIGGVPRKVIRTRLLPGAGTRVECGDGPLWVVESAGLD